MHLLATSRVQNTESQTQTQGVAAQEDLWRQGVTRRRESSRLVSHGRVDQASLDASHESQHTRCHSTWRRRRPPPPSPTRPRSEHCQWRSSVMVSMYIRCAPRHGDTLPSVRQGDRKQTKTSTASLKSRFGQLQVAGTNRGGGRLALAFENEPFNKHVAKHEVPLRKTMTKRNKRLASGSRKIRSVFVLHQRFTNLVFGSLLLTPHLNLNNE